MPLACRMAHRQFGACARCAIIRRRGGAPAAAGPPADAMRAVRDLELPVLTSRGRQAGAYCSLNEAGRLACTGKWEERTLLG